MKTYLVVSMALAFLPLAFAWADSGFESDIFPTSGGDLVITFVGHGSLVFTFAGKVIHVDPYSGVADYATLPKADLVLITHEHFDHLDPAALEQIRTKETVVAASAAAAKKVPGALTLVIGETKTLAGIPVETAPAYNIVHERSPGQPFHPPQLGNGYVLTFGDKRVYVAGDTENIPEMKDLTGIDIAFLPMNLPYTMTPEMAADAARSFRPAVLYPYHFGDTDTARLVELLEDEPEIEVRIRKMP